MSDHIVYCPHCKDYVDGPDPYTAPGSGEIFDCPECHGKSEVWCDSFGEEDILFLVLEKVRELTALEVTAAPLRGKVAIVENPVECSDFSHLIGHRVLLDGALVKVTGVERFAHAAPWRAGEKIGLILDTEAG